MGPSLVSCQNLVSVARVSCWRVWRVRCALTRFLLYSRRSVLVQRPRICQQPVAPLWLLGALVREARDLSGWEVADTFSGLPAAQASGDRLVDFINHNQNQRYLQTVPSLRQSVFMAFLARNVCVGKALRRNDVLYKVLGGGPMHCSRNTAQYTTQYRKSGHKTFGLHLFRISMKLSDVRLFLAVVAQ
jgi:hypothetical protein